MVKPLSECNRLKKPSSFQTTYRCNQVRQRGRYFTVLAFYYASNKNDVAKLGVVASKKVSKKAVTRNKLKRIMREAYKSSCLPDGFYYVFIAKIGADAIDNKMLHSDLKQTIKKLETICEKYPSC